MDILMAALMENSKAELLDDLKATMTENSKAALKEKPGSRCWMN
jgi:hypothetical protein